MKAQELWNEYKTINPSIGDEYDAWAFGVEPDALAELVRRGVKTATASAYDLYLVENEPLPPVGRYDIILDGQDEAVCITRPTKVTVLPFKEVSADHAYKEGEGFDSQGSDCQRLEMEPRDLATLKEKALAYWQQIHEEFFSQCLQEAGLVFTEDSLVVCEEFEVVYPLGKDETDR